MHFPHGTAAPFLLPFSVLFLRRSWIASCSDFGANLALYLGRFGAKLAIFGDIFRVWLGIFFGGRFEDDFYSISDPPDPQKTYENLRFFKDFAFSARSLWTSILGRFLLHFRTRIRSKSAHRGVRTRPEKRYKKKLHLEGFGVDFAWILGPSLDPGGGPRTPFWAFLALLGSLGGKMAPGCAKSASKTDFGPILVDFWSIFGPFFVVLCRRFFEFGLLSRSRSWHYVLPSCGGSLTTQSQNPFIEARWRRKPEGQLDI